MGNWRTLSLTDITPEDRASKGAFPALEAALVKLRHVYLEAMAPQEADTTIRLVVMANRKDEL